MSDLEKALEEKNLAQEAYRRKEYDTSILHYSNAMRLNPKDTTFIYHIAKICFEKKRYSESIKFCSRAIKVGKEQKANVKMVAKTMAMRGRAHKELGEMEKFTEDIEKAVKFLTTIANVKFEKERWEECIDFCQRACEIGKEDDFVDAELLVLQSKATARLHAENQKKLGNEAYKKRDFEMAMKHYLKATEFNPDEITFFNNIAAVKLEQKKYKESLEFCTKAIEVGKENRADSKKIQKAMDRLARVQKLLEEQSENDTFERVKRGILKAKPHMDLQGLTVRYNADTKEFVICAPELKEMIFKANIKEWSPQEEERWIKNIADVLEDLREGRVNLETAQIPAVYNPDSFGRDFAYYFSAKELDPQNMNHIYDAAELLFEKGNYKGCATVLLGVERKKFVVENDRTLQKIKRLRGRALRRDYGFGEDFDAKLAQGKREDGHASLEDVQRMLTEACNGRSTGTPQEAERWMSASDIDGDGKVTLEQCFLTFRTASVLAAKRLETDMSRSLEAAGLSEMGPWPCLGGVDPEVRKKVEGDLTRSLEAIGINMNTLLAEYNKIRK